MPGFGPEYSYLTLTKCIASTLQPKYPVLVSATYPVVLVKSEEGYAVSCPALPGCWSQGKTEDEALKNIREAIQDYLAAVTDSLKGADVREVEIITD
jgi:predicted RNase H-like HicB family nuclease